MDNLTAMTSHVTLDKQPPGPGGGPPRRENPAAAIAAGKIPTSPRQGANGAAPSRGNSWSDRGAATIIQSHQDPSGSVQTRIIKKSVEDFSLGETLGEGAYSTVVAATDRQTLRQYAIKVLDKRHIIREKKVKYVNIEKNTLNRLGEHPGIIKLYYTFQDYHSLYFVLDCASHGDLLSLLKRFGSLDEACSRYYTCQILDAVEYMHNMGVIHRDLKPENILLDDKMRVKITDFGTAKLLDFNDQTQSYPEDVRANSFVGTAEYVPPELLTGKSTGKSSDIWAFGCILYQMIAGSPPFTASNEYQIFQRIIKLNFSYSAGFPLIVRDLVKRILVKEPSSRLSVAQIKRHKFYAGVEWDRRSIWKRPPPKLQPFQAFSSGSSNAAKLMPFRQQHTQQALRQAKQLASGPPRVASAGNLIGNYQRQPSSQNQQPHHQQSQRLQPSPMSQAQNAASSSAHNLSTPGAGTVSASAAAAALAGRQNGLPPINTQAQIKSVPRSTSAAASSPSAPVSSSPLAQSPAQPVSQSSQQPQAPATTQKSRPSQGAPDAEFLIQQQRELQQLAQERRLALQQRQAEARKQMQLQRRESDMRIATPSSPKDSAAHSGAIRAVTPSSAETEGRRRASEDQKTRSPSTAVKHLSPPSATMVDAEWAFLLKSSDERILKIGTVYVITANASNYEEPVADEKESSSNKFSKLFSTKKKQKRHLIVTTAGRMLFVGPDDQKLRMEIPFVTPQVSLREYPFNKKTQMGAFSIETHNKVFTVEDPNGSYEWMNVVAKAREYVESANAVNASTRHAVAAAAALAVSNSQQAQNQSQQKPTRTMLQRHEMRKNEARRKASGW